jgi:hypothetical protein
MDLETFVREQNIRRYRRLLERSTSAEQRMILANLLAQELAKLNERPESLARRAERQCGARQECPD